MMGMLPPIAPPPFNATDSEMAAYYQAHADQDSDLWRGFLFTVAAFVLFFVVLICVGIRIAMS